MMTEFEERNCQGLTKLQFTVSRKSLPNLLEWSDRFQIRFNVTIDIQWELDQQVAPIDDNPQVRWVLVQGQAENCKKAKNYIVIFCDPKHQMDVTYPDYVDKELRGLQIYLEENYSVVMRFFKVGQLLLKSHDEMNLSLVVSFIEKMSVNEHDQRLKQDQPSELSGFVGFERRSPIESIPPYLAEDELYVDSLVDDFQLTPTAASQLQRTKTSTDSTPSTPDGKHLLGGEPLSLKSKGDHILPGQVLHLLTPPSSFKGFSISPDRKKIKSEDDPGSVASFGSESKTHPRITNLLTLNLSSQQELAIQRILRRGDFTRFEVDRILQKYGNDWKCSELFVLLSDARKQRDVTHAPSRLQMDFNDKLDELKSTQESLMKGLLETESPVSIPHDMHGSATSRQITNEADESVIILDETDNSIIIIPSDSDSEIVIGDSIYEPHTSEVFYNNGAGKSRLPQSKVKQERTGMTGRGLTQADKQNAELKLVIDGLKHQMKDLQDQVDREKADASSQQQVVALLQQTQQEHIQQQYEQQQERLLEQQQQFLKHIQQQEQELKMKQEMALKEMQQIQREAKTVPDNPSEGITITPAKKNMDSPLRPVVIDGSNVAMKHGRNKVFSCRGIAICIQYFQKRGHEDITVFVPQGRSTQNPNARDRPMTDQKLLDMLEKRGLLSYTPSRRIGSQYVNCYDDRFIVKLAVENGGVIVSNDNYRDLMGESPEWKYVIENRLVMYTFAGDHFMIPDDPLGRKGPRIEEILRKPRRIGTGMVGHPKRPDTHFKPAGSQAAWPALPAATTGAPLLATGRSTGAQVAPDTLLKPAGSLAARPALPSAATGNPPWATGTATGAQVVRHGISPASARKHAAKPALAANFGKLPGKVQRDMTKHPSYEALMAIFPDNEDTVQNVLSEHGNNTDSNELVILILVEKEKAGGAK